MNRSRLLLKPDIYRNIFLIAFERYPSLIISFVFTNVKSHVINNLSSPPKRRAWQNLTNNVFIRLHVILIIEIYLKISTAEWVGDLAKSRLDQFNLDVIDRMSEPPWNSTYAKENGLTVKIQTITIFRRSLKVLFSTSANVAQRSVNR